MSQRFNPPPGWPPAPEGFRPTPGWRPPASWPAPPPGWQLWVSDDEPSAAEWSSRATRTRERPGPAQQRYRDDSYHETSDQYNDDRSYETDSQYDDRSYRSDSQYDDDRSYRSDSQYDDRSYRSAAQQGRRAPYGGPGGAGARYPGQGDTRGRHPGWDDAGAGSDAYPPRDDYARFDQPTRTNGFAIASLVLGIIGGAVISAILGFVALGKIKRTGERGRGMAVAGIFLSVIWIIILLTVTVGNLGRATRGPNGQVNKGGTLSVFSLHVGDCFNLPSSLSGIQTVTAIPCTQSHDAQVYATFSLGGSAYPANIKQLGDQGCEERKGSVNTSLVTSSMNIYSFYPDQNGWASGSTSVQCAIASPGADIKTSLLNT
jgi:hypothetical protein